MALEVLPKDLQRAAKESAVDKLSSLANVGETRAVLERHGLATKHALGQNFLVSDDIVRKIVALAGLSPTDCVLEVGPGIGTLSEALLKSAHSVVAVERDPDLPAVLAETLAPWDASFTLVEKDALALDANDLLNFEGHAPNKFVANLPYAVAATVVLDFFQRFACIESSTVMVQREVAERMMAVPGNKNYGAYTVKLSLYAQPEGKFSVAPGNFFPPPHVESTVLRLDRCAISGDDGLPLSALEREAASVMADAAFANRRKTIANSCKTYFTSCAQQWRLPGDVAQSLSDMFARCGIDGRRRGETLDLREFVRLGKALLEMTSFSV